MIASDGPLAAATVEDVVRAIEALGPLYARYATAAREAGITGEALLTVEDGDEDGAGADARRSKDATRGSQGCGCAKREVESPPRSIGPRGEGAVAKVARPFRGLSVTQTSRLPLQQTKAKNCAAKLCCQVSAARRRHPR